MNGENFTDMASELEIDEIGYWSEVKLAILEKYAKPYNQIIKKKRLRTIYVDGFAGLGKHLSRRSGEIVEGSPARALKSDPPFDFYHFIDLNEQRTTELEKLTAGRKNVQVHCGDCNRILIDKIFPTIRYENYQRSLCILDPYGLHLEWNVIKAAADTKAIEIFLNFPVMDMNRNVFWKNPDGVSEASRQRMTLFWGDRSWEQAAYQPVQTLFGDVEEKTTNEEVARAFQERLKTVAGFKYVPDPMPMRNSRGAIVYYLFFAAHDKTAPKIVNDIFNGPRNRGEIGNV